MSIDIDKLEDRCKRASMWGQADTMLELIARLRDAEASAAEYKQDGEQWKAAHDDAVDREQALAAHCHLYRQAVFHFNRSRGDINPLLLLMDKEPETSLHRLITEKQVEAFLEVAAWMEQTSEKFSGPTYHEAEMVGMEISGPTHCSDARQCMKAGNRAFLEAARIWEYRAKETAA